MSAVPARAYFLFLEGDMDGAATALGTVTGARPEVARGAAPRFGDARFLRAVGAEACLRTLDYGRYVDTDEMRGRFALWSHAVECDRADAVERIMGSEAARADT